MAIIKINRSQARVADVPVPNVSALTLDSNLALAQGNAIASIGKVINETAKKTKTTEDKNELQKIYSNDYFQWYDLDLLKKNIESLKTNKNKVYEFYSAPIENKKIINLFKKLDSKKIRLNPIKYKFRPKNGYMFSEKYTLLRIKKFIKKYEY